jgi:hypothetical protein
MTIVETESLELYDVTKTLVEISRGINNAAARLLRMVGDLIGPASPDPEESGDEDMSGCECKRDSAQPSIERRSHEQNRRSP